MREYRHLFIGGAWVAPRGSGLADVINPARRR